MVSPRTASPADGRLATTGLGALLAVATPNEGAPTEAVCRKSTAGSAARPLATAGKGCPRHCFSSHSTHRVRPSDTGNPQALHFLRFRSIGGTLLWSSAAALAASGPPCAAADHISGRFTGCSCARTTISGTTTAGTTTGGTTIGGIDAAIAAGDTTAGTLCAGRTA